MGNYSVTIRTMGEDEGSAAGMVVDHYIAGRAELEIERLTGGHLLHLAVAGCLFNDILREAKAKSIPIQRLAVLASGDFDDIGSSGISYEIEIESDADAGIVKRLVEDQEAIATIPKVARDGTTVERADLRITKPGGS